MYDSLINKMTEHFSEVGSILFSKACDFSKLHDISIEDIEMYYDILCSDEPIPANIIRRNHKMCCLFYLSKENPEYREDFFEKYLQTIDIHNLEKNNENLFMVFNIIEFDKTYLNSPLNNMEYLYSLLKIFSNFETDFKSFIIYKYYRGYLKFRIGDINQANREYLEITSEVMGNEDFLMKYIKLLNDLLKVKIYTVSERKNRADFNEYIQFLQTLFGEVKDYNKTLSLKIGFDLFQAYIEGKEFQNCIPLLNQMKKILKKDLLRGATMKNGIDYYLAIASRLGYIGILLNHKPSIQSATKKIKKALGMLDHESQDKRTIEILKAYRFVIANLEVWLNQETNYDLKKLATEFQKTFLPDLKSNAFKNYIVTENNKESIIMDFKIINNMNQEVYIVSKSIGNSCYKNILDYKKENINDFIILLSFYHDKIYRYSESFVTDEDDNKKNVYKAKIKEYFKEANAIIKKFHENEFFQTPFAKILVINIYYSYASILLIEKKEVNKVREIIDDMMDKQTYNLRNKLKIDKSIPSYGLWLKVKGDYYFLLKHFDAAIESYKNALDTLEKGNSKIPLILFNCGCAYYFMKNKPKAIEYLNRSISSFSNLKENDKYFGLSENKDKIIKKINVAKSLVEALSNENKK